MKEIFITYAPYITFLFIIALPPEVIRNFRTKTYASGTISSWAMRITGYGVFGVYSLFINQYIVAFVQGVVLLLSVTILVQRFVYKEKKPMLKA